LQLLASKYPVPDTPPPIEMPSAEEVSVFRVTPTVISVIDYSKGFGHTDLVTC
jgi:hypothetical protein